MIPLLATLMTFLPSPTVGAFHECAAWRLDMVESLCYDPLEDDLIRCEVIAPPEPVPCLVAGEAVSAPSLLPGEALMFCIRAKVAGSAWTRCAEPVTWEPE